MVEIKYKTGFPSEYTRGSLGLWHSGFFCDQREREGGCSNINPHRFDSYRSSDWCYQIDAGHGTLEQKPRQSSSLRTITSQRRLFKTQSWDTLVLLDGLNTFAGEQVFIARVTGMLWEIFYLWAERISAACFDYQKGASPSSQSTLLWYLAR